MTTPCSFLESFLIHKKNPLYKHHKVLFLWPSLTWALSWIFRLETFLNYNGIKLRIKAPASLRLDCFGSSRPGLPLKRRINISGIDGVEIREAVSHLYLLTSNIWHLTQRVFAAGFLSGRRLPLTMVDYELLQLEGIGIFLACDMTRKKRYVT